MTTVLELHRRARELGLRLEPRGDKLIVTPADRCPSDFADALRANKRELLDWLNTPPCPGWRALPPVDLPLNPVRPDLDTVDARLVMEYVVRQIPGVCPLCEWCLRRELDLWNTFTWSHEDCALAAARDCALWQQGVSTDAELIERLEAFGDLSNTRNTP